MNLASKKLTEQMRMLLAEQDALGVVAIDGSNGARTTENEID